MESELITPELPIKLTDEDLDAQFDQHNIDVEAILARTQRSFNSRSRRHVSLYEAPEFVKRLNAFEEVTAGDTVAFECQWKAFPKPTIKWYKDDQEVTEDARYTAETDDGTGIVRLLVTGVKKSDEGAYKCKAENQEGVASTTGYLSVTGSASNVDKTLAAQQKKEKKAKKTKQEKQQQEDPNGADSEDDKGLRKVQCDSKVSYPPHLRTIVEQKSLEEREAESVQNQPPSPIQEFIEKMQSGRGRGATWPYSVMGYQVGQRDDDAQSHSSDTSVESQVEFDLVNFEASPDDDDVFTSSDPDDSQHSWQSENQSSWPSEDQTSWQNENELAQRQQLEQLWDEAERQKQQVKYNQKQQVLFHEQQRLRQLQQPQQETNAQSNGVSGVSPSCVSSMSETIVSDSAQPISMSVRPLCGRPLCIPEIQVSTNVTSFAAPSLCISKGTSPKRKSTEQVTSNGKAQKDSRQMTLDIGHLVDVLDTPWIYFLPVTSSMTFVASATEMSPILLVLIMVVISLVAFYVLFSEHGRKKAPHLNN